MKRRPHEGKGANSTCFDSFHSDRSKGSSPSAGSRHIVRSCSIPAALGCRTSGM